MRWIVIDDAGHYIESMAPDEDDVVWSTITPRRSRALRFTTHEAASIAGGALGRRAAVISVSHTEDLSVARSA